MKLYNVPRNTRISLVGEIKVPPDARPLMAGDVLDFKHIDGMYSLCVDPRDGAFVHLVAWAEVEIISPASDLSLDSAHDGKSRRTRPGKSSITQSPNEHSPVS